MKQQENRAEPQEKQIRFIDSHYNLKFYIPDGGKIRITFRDGHTADRVCKYIDDYHLYVGNCCYHICEFAEKMELSGSKVEPVNQSEPSKNKTRNNIAFNKLNAPDLGMIVAGAIISAIGMLVGSLWNKKRHNQKNN